MDMPGPSASSEISLEERLCQSVEKWKKKELTIICAPAEPANIFSPFKSPNRGNEASPNRGNEASPNIHHERGSKWNASRVSNEKMGPRQGAVGKHRQQRHTSKGTIKVYPTDPINFRALVYAHTCQLSSAPPQDVAAQPTSPLTPHSITSTSSTCGCTSQPSSPTTPHSIPSTSTSPLSSPHHGHPNDGLYLNSLPLEGHAQLSPHLNTHFSVPSPFKVHAEHGPHLNTHLNVHPLLYNANQNLNPSDNISLHQSTYMPRSASTPYLGVSNQADNVPWDADRPQGISPDLFARVLSLKRFLMDDDTVCN